MYMNWNWNDFQNLLIIAVVTGLTVRLLLLALKRWLGIEFPARRVGVLVGLIMGFIAGFRFAHDLQTGLLVSLGLVGSNLAIILVNHFIPTRRRGR